MMIAIFYHFLAPEGGHPTLEEHFIEKKNQNARSFFLSHICKLNKKNSEILLLTNIDNKFDIFPLCISLTNPETL